MCFTLGFDPEIIGHMDGVFERASNHFKFNSSFGLDDNNDIAEIRPGISENPIDLTAKIKVILEYGHEKAQTLWLQTPHTK